MMEKAKTAVENALKPYSNEDALSAIISLLTDWCDADPRKAVVWCEILQAAVQMDKKKRAAH